MLVSELKFYVICKGKTLAAFANEGDAKNYCYIKNVSLSCIRADNNNTPKGE